MRIKFAAPQLPYSGTLVMLVAEGGKLSPVAQAADEASGGHITRCMKAADFDGKKDQTLDIVAPPALGLDRILLLGVGDPLKIAAREAELLGGTACGVLLGTKVKEGAVLVETAGEPTLSAAQFASSFASGIKLRSYTFLKYKTKSKNERPKLAAVNLLTVDATPARRAFAALDAVAEGVSLARDLVNEPGNVLDPVEFADRTRGLERYGVAVEVLEPRDMRKLGMGALLGVAQGSKHPARLVVMQWNGGSEGEAPVAIIGKGVTFDTGGISIKPAQGMEDMKGDMAGAACVAGLMAALAGRKAKVNAVGIIGLVENMPDGNAQRPGDIVKSMSGQTIAVLNTDAEGRLVLADALWYCQDRFKPQFMIDLATLTGAILVALGKEHAGLFSNNDELADRLFEAGQATGEKVWRMPLGAEYDKLIDSDVADMKNIGGRNAGSITAAQFLQRFVNDVPWAHLDVAGTAMDSVKSSINQSWGSGWGVRLLDRLIASNYEG